VDLKQFAVLMKKRADKLPTNVAEVMRDVTKAVLETVVPDTPVDTGEALSNWQVGINKNDFFVRPPFAPGHGGSTKTENVRATIAAGLAAVAPVKSGQVIHVTNVAPQIVKLNEGSSIQAPAAFVEKGVLKGLEKLKTAKLIRD
jgi:hypothetical protein